MQSPKAWTTWVPRQEISLGNWSRSSLTDEASVEWGRDWIFVAGTRSGLPSEASVPTSKTVGNFRRKSSCTNFVQLLFLLERSGRVTISWLQGSRRMVNKSSIFDSPKASKNVNFRIFCVIIALADTVFMQKIALPGTKKGLKCSLFLLECNLLKSLFLPLSSSFSV